MYEVKRCTGILLHGAAMEEIDIEQQEPFPVDRDGRRLQRRTDQPDDDAKVGCCDKFQESVSKWMLPEDMRSKYLERANCCPPPIFIILISIAEVLSLHQLQILLLHTFTFDVVMLQRIISGLVVLLLHLLFLSSFLDVWLNSFIFLKASTITQLEQTRQFSLSWQAPNSPRGCSSGIWDDVWPLWPLAAGGRILLFFSHLSASIYTPPHSCLQTKASAIKYFGNQLFYWIFKLFEYLNQHAFS